MTQVFTQNRTQTKDHFAGVAAAYREAHNGPGAHRVHP